METEVNKATEAKEFKPIEFGIDSFINDFSTPTETKTPGKPLLEEIQEQPDTIELAPEQPTTNVENVAQAALDHAKKTLRPETQAMVYFQLINSSQTLGFTALHKKKLKKRVTEPISDVVNHIDQLEVNKDFAKQLTPEQLKNCSLTQKAFSKIERLPFTEEEREMLIDSLSQVISENQGEMPPSMAIAIILGSATLTRIVDLMLD